MPRIDGMSHDFCDNCGAKNSSQFWDFDDGTVLCNNCNKHQGKIWQKAVSHKKSSTFTLITLCVVALLFLLSAGAGGWYYLQEDARVAEYQSNITDLQESNSRLQRAYNSVNSQVTSLSVEKDTLQTEYDQNIEDYNALVNKYNGLIKSCKSDYDNAISWGTNGMQTITQQCNVKYGELYNQCYSLQQQSQTLAYNYQACKQQLGQVADINNIISTGQQVAQLMSLFGLI
jgi:hypothetical protein